MLGHSCREGWKDAASSPGRINPPMKESTKTTKNTEEEGIFRPMASHMRGIGKTAFVRVTETSLTN